MRIMPAQSDASPDTTFQQSVAKGLPVIESVSVCLIALDRLSSFNLSNHFLNAFILLASATFCGNDSYVKRRKVLPSLFLKLNTDLAPSQHFYCEKQGIVIF